MKILSVVGARPEFVQAAPICRVLRGPYGKPHREILVHTGQHYDDRMSRVFFEELGIPTPDYDLGVGSGSHAEQTAAMLTGLEKVLAGESPDVVVVRGDTNSTLAAALAAAKLGIRIAHVEAGERSFERSMPEEINRVVTDHVSSIFFCVSKRAIDNLAREGVTDSVHHVGDVMYDALLQNLPVARRNATVLARHGLAPKSYYLVTIHRAGSTGSRERLAGLLEGLGGLDRPVVFPLHPRTAAALVEHRLAVPANILVVPPLGYFDMLVAEENAAAIGTDSGGVQREAYGLGVPCVTLRDETEWTETLALGWNRLVGTDPATIRAGFAAASAFPAAESRLPIFGDGHAAEAIVRILTEGQPSRRPK